MRQPIIGRLPWRLLWIFLLIPNVSHASFIESSMGAAVVNDATATYYNPAALTLLENSQIIALGSGMQFHSEFNGEVTRFNNDFSQSGTSKSQSTYFLPSTYLGIPLSNKFFFGLSVLANNFGRDLDQNSMLRYSISDNNIQDIDVVPALGFKLNDYFSVGAGLNFSQADFRFTPVSASTNLDNPDIQSHNQANATALGGDFGLLLKPSLSTQIGLNYRSAMTYHFKGTSEFDSIPATTSNNFAFDYWTPARYTLSVNQFLSRSFGLIGTLQWIKWDIYDQINATGVATQQGSNPVILSDVTVPLHFRNGWVYTLGGYYRLSSKWIVRMASSYVESPGNPNYQVTEGNNIILGASVGYKLNKKVSIDASYAHAFIEDQTINIENAINTIDGINQGYRDSISLKITANV